MTLTIHGVFEINCV